MPAKLMTLAEVAEYLSATERQVRDLVYRRKIPHVRVGRLLRFRPAEIEQWLEENKR